MLTLISSLAGFFTSLLPEILHLIKDKKDKEHELKLINLQIEAMKCGNTTRLEEVQIQAERDESKYLYAHASRQTKIKWVDGLSASVRPMVTYSFFLLYITLKIMSFIKIGSMPVIWTDEDQGIFCAVIGFWFGYRSVNKYRISNNGHA